MSPRCLFFIHVLLLSLTQAYAQSSFTWQFTGDVGLSLPQCGTLPVKVTSTSSTTKASYYMIALAANGTPTTSLIGSGDSLQWTVNQPVGSKLILYVVDSNGANAPTPASLYTVTSGSSDCLSSSTSSSFTVTTDASSTISTCDPLALSIRGGTSPYNVLLASLDAGSVTNITMKSGDNRYTYINRAAPQSVLLAAISDATGKWATGSPFVSTQGSTDTACGGAESTSSHVTLPDISSTTSASNSATSSGKSSATSGTVSPTLSPSQVAQSGEAKKTNKTPIIVGVVVGVAVLLLLAGIVLWVVRRKQSSRNEMSTTSPEMSPVVNPFTTPSDYAETASSVPQKSPVNQPTSPLGSGNYFVSNPETATQRSTIVEPVRKTQAYTTESQQRVEDGSETVVQHTDGRRLTVREVPPPYGTQSS